MSARTFMRRSSYGWRNCASVGGWCPSWKARNWATRSSTWFLSESLVITPIAFESLSFCSSAFKSMGGAVGAAAATTGGAFGAGAGLAGAAGFAGGGGAFGFPGGPVDCDIGGVRGGGAGGAEGKTGAMAAQDQDAPTRMHSTRQHP